MEVTLSVMINTGQTASVKCRVFDRNNTVGDGDVSEATALVKCIVSDGSNAVGNGDAGEVATVVERIAADVGNTRTDHDAPDLVAIRIPWNSVFFEPGHRYPVTADNKCPIAVQCPSSSMACPSDRVIGLPCPTGNNFENALNGLWLAEITDSVAISGAYFIVISDTVF